jgi:hypothetical protein
MTTHLHLQTAKLCVSTNGESLGIHYVCPDGEPGDHVECDAGAANVLAERLNRPTAESHAVLVKALNQTQAEIVTLIARLPQPFARNMQALYDANKAALKASQSAQ